MLELFVFTINIVYHIQMFNFKTITNKFIVVNTLIHFALSSLVLLSLRDTTFSVLNLFAFSKDTFMSGYVWQPLTALFMHIHIIHLLFNMISLFSIGNYVESLMTRSKFLQLYFITGLGSFLLTLLVPGYGSHPAIGASGAICGIFAYLVALRPNERMILFIIPASAKTLGYLFVVVSIILAIFDKASNVSHIGHLGGFALGYLFYRYMR